MNRKAESDIRRKKKVLDYAEECGNVSFACRKYGVSRDSYYRWKKQRDNDGLDALANSKPCPENPAIRVAKEIEDKILYVRKEFGLGPQRIGWYLERHHVFSGWAVLRARCLSNSVSFAG